MTQEEKKAKAYDEAVRKAKDIIKYYETHNREYEASIEDLEAIFPELKEKDDERIRKELIKQYSISLKEHGSNCIWRDGITYEDVIAWLEKQNEQSVEPEWRHHKIDFSGCSEEYRKAYYDGWNSCNMQHSQFSAELGDVVECLINGFIKYYYDETNEEIVWGTYESSMPVKHIIEVLERLSKMTQSYTNNN